MPGAFRQWWSRSSSVFALNTRRCCLLIGWGRRRCAQKDGDVVYDNQTAVCTITSFPMKMILPEFSHFALSDTRARRSPILASGFHRRRRACFGSSVDFASPFWWQRMLTGCTGVVFAYFYSFEDQNNSITLYALQKRSFSMLRRS